MIAVKTVAAIDACLAADQGNAYRANLQKTLPALSDAYEQETTGHRSHLGASLIGDECGRKLWYIFRWVKDVPVEPKMIRLFNRGHLEEGRLVALLLAIGCKVYQFDDDGNQFRIAYVDGHFGGGLDCVIEECPDIPDRPILGEFKTHNKKSFEKLVSAGAVRKAKQQHYVQMQLYMGYYRLEYGLYLASCKDDDRLFAEIVPYDSDVDLAYRARAAGVIAAPLPLPRIANTSSHYSCRFCDYMPVCFGAQAPERNCRTCVHSKIVPNGWACGLTGNMLSKEEQLAGCSSHQFIPKI